MAMSKHAHSLRAAARARYREAAANTPPITESLSTPTRTASPSDPGSSPGQALPLAGGGVSAARVADTPLIGQMRKLYEETVVPVTEIARLAGVGERTVYEYASTRAWRPRVKRLARAAGGRFVLLAGEEHAAQLQARERAARAAAQACAEAGVIAQAAMATAVAAAEERLAERLAEKDARDASARAAEQERQNERDVRNYEMLCNALVELVKARYAREWGKIPQADRLDAKLQDIILAEMGRLSRRRRDAVIANT
jgi:hypothetical protein